MDQRGVALILTLAFLVLLSAVVLAFFSRAMTTRQVSYSSAGQARAEQIAGTALWTVTADLINEMRAGSENPDANPGEALHPLNSSTSQPYRTTSNRSVDPDGTIEGITNLVRGSFQNAPFWQGPAYDSEGPIRVYAGGANSTASPSSNGRFIRPSRWGLPRLHDDDSQLGDEFVSPGWIYLARSGPLEVDPEGPDFEEWGDRSPGNDDHVVGRYAFMVYDLSGLLDVNVAGHLAGDAPDVSPDLQSKRGHPAFADLGMLDGAAVDLNALIQWRHESSRNLNDEESIAPYQFLYGNLDPFQPWPDHDFRYPRSGDQGFVSRMDLIRAAQLQDGLGVFQPEHLNRLTTFSRTVNAPHWRPDPDRPRVNRAGTAGPDDRINPDPLSIRVDSAFTRRNGSEARPGEPLIRNRFPIGKLALLEDPDADADEIEAYFGLRRSGEVWNYVHAGVGAGGNEYILALSDVAALPPGQAREPNFFELLQAGIVTGSLGSAVTQDTEVRSIASDQNIFNQIIKIGANLIDQFDADDIPTTIRFNDEEFYGIENLPYLYVMPSMMMRIPNFGPGFPLQDENMSYIGGWYQFGLWNAHQNADQADEDLQLRIVIEEGRARAIARSPNNANGLWRDFSENPAFFEFTNNASFSDLTFLDTEHPASQGVFPSATGSPSSDPEYPFQMNILPPVVNTEPSTPVGTESRIGNPTHRGWAGIYVGRVFAPEPDLESPETFDQTAFEVHYRRANIDTDMADPPIVKLQVRRGADEAWRTYQRIDGIIGGAGLRNHNNLRNEDWNVFNNRREIYFLSQNSQGGGRPVIGGNGMISLDPRTQRYGMHTRGNTRQFNRSFAPPGVHVPSQSKGDLTQEEQFPGTVLTSSPNGNFTYDSGNRFRQGALTDNRPEASYVPEQQTYSTDPDGRVRPADGHSDAGAYPDLFGFDAYQRHRGLVLNRPFRNPAEFGYAFRDQVMKTLDFVHAQSGDLALLDYFGVEENEILPGRVNINTPHPDVMAALLAGAQLRERVDGNAGLLPTDTAREIADQLTTRANLEPFLNLGEVVSFLSSVLDEDDQPLSPHKTEKESVVRALSGLSQSRTWNLFVDVFSQSGRFPATANGFDDFVVEGETRYWMQIALDRYTGEIVDYQIEPVKE